MSKTSEWLEKWIDEHDLGGITVGEIKADLQDALATPMQTPGMREAAVLLRNCLRAITDGVGNGYAPFIAAGRRAVIETGFLDAASPAPVDGRRFE